MSFGPWQPDISETEQHLRCRELCVVAALLLGHDHPLPTTLRQAETDRLTARRRDPNFPEGGELDTWVIIRADKATPFNKLYKVIKLCRDEGYRNFAFRALAPAEAIKAQRGAA